MFRFIVDEEGKANEVVDYLTVLATRSLIFFPHDQPHPLSPNPNQSSSPETTPEQRTTLLHPDPVYLPLQSLAWADNQCALYLLDHILSTCLPNYEPSSPHTTSLLDKRLIADAEGMVWKEVEKGKQFVRAVGEWFNGSDGGISDYQLKVLAQRCGVVVKEEEEAYDYGHGIEAGKAGTVHSVQEVFA
jgi:hypothetical protein